MTILELGYQLGLEATNLEVLKDRCWMRSATHAVLLQERLSTASLARRRTLSSSSEGGGGSRGRAPPCS